MSKIQKTNQRAYVPQSDWMKDIWGQDDYKRHIKDFLQIKKEYDLIRETVYSAIMSRWYWLESKNVVRIIWKENRFGEKYPDFQVKMNYSEYSNMFSRFTEWWSLEEKKMAQQSGETLPIMKIVMSGIDKTKLKESFSVPADFRQMKFQSIPLGIKDDFGDFTEQVVNDF